MRKWIRSSAIPAFLWCSASAFAQQALQPLSDQSRAEFDRIFGAGPAPTQTVKDRSFSISDRLSRDTKNLTMTNMTVALTDASSPETTRKLSALKLLESAALPNGALDAATAFHFWHLIALDTTSNDHASYPSSRGVGPAYQQVGPARTSRAMAMIHIAMFETINLLMPDTRKYSSYLYDDDDHEYLARPAAPADHDKDVVVAAAVSAAAYTMLAQLYPGLTAPHGEDDKVKSCDSVRGSARPFSLNSYADCFDIVAVSKNKDYYQQGVLFGRRVAQDLLNKRSADNSSTRERSIGPEFRLRVSPDDGPLPVSQWAPDPVSKAQTALGTSWGGVTPFTLASSSEFRETLPRYSDMQTYRKLLDSGNFRDLPSYDAIKRWGCDATYQPKMESDLNCLNARRPGEVAQPDGYLVAKFWAYDGTAGLCAPARLYNEVVDHVLADLDNAALPNRPVVRAPNNLDKLVDRARLYALVNTAMADAAIAAWDVKYYFQFPRPVTVIRAEIARAANHAPNAPDYPATWFPVGAQNSNSDGGINITPPFPAYVSGHATFGGALFGVLRQFFSPGATFGFRSDEFNGWNKDALNYIRCKEGDGYKDTQFCKGRTLDFDCAERENADSRLTMGVHWVFDADDGINLGNKVAGRAYRKLFRDLAIPSLPKQNAIYSADGGKTRKDLQCADVTWPDKWVESMDDAKMGSGDAFRPTFVDDVSLNQ